MAQLAVPNLQGGGLLDRCNQQGLQDGQDSMNHAPEDSKPATTSSKPPLAHEPGSDVRTPGPPAPPQPMLESKRRYMIDNDDDIDLVEAGAGNKQVMAAALSQDKTLEGGEAEDEAEGNMGLISKEAQFLSVTCHVTGEF